MYIPAINKMIDREAIISFMEQFSFATIISNTAIHKPEATHLPFLITPKGDDLFLVSHFAKANTQWKQIQNNKNILVIFQEPHAYISPSHYEKTLNVPTWNYIAVHAYGQGELITEDQDVLDLMDQTIINYDAIYKKQYDTLPQDFKLKMIKGVVAFRIKVTELQAKHKLSQNKTIVEQKNIIDSLAQSVASNETLIAEYMKNNLLNP